MPCLNVSMRFSEFCFLFWVLGFIVGVLLCCRLVQLLVVQQVHSMDSTTVLYSFFSSLQRFLLISLSCILFNSLASQLGKPSLLDDSFGRHMQMCI